MGGGGGCMNIFYVRMGSVAFLKEERILVRGGCLDGMGRDIHIEIVFS